MVVEPGQNRDGDNDTGPLHLSFPKIISAHSDGAVRKELAW
jgi:hypothetical protein